GDGLAGACTLPGGQEIWTRTYTSPGFFEDRAYHLAIDSHGDIVVVGHTTKTGEGFNNWARRYSSDGDEGWTLNLDGMALMDEEAWSIEVLPDDSFVVAGYLTTPESGPDVWVAAVTPEGQFSWQRTSDGGRLDLDEARDVVVAPDGDLVLIGYTTSTELGGTDLWYQRRSPDGVDVRWTRTRPGFVDYSQDRAHGIAAIGDDFVGVGFRQNDDGSQSWPWIARFDRNGDDVWNDDGMDDAGVFTAIEVLANGNLVIAGDRRSAQGDGDMWLQTRSPDGAVLWQETIASPSGSDDRANTLTVDRDGGFIVGGELGAGTGSTDAWIRRYDAALHETWTTTYSGPAGDRDTVWGVGIDPRGDVVVCGYGSTPETGWDIWVRKYSP
ncbi:MAG TPA: hypothetical protein VG755_06295, partial [Nannocystaceae bacterium]|nr:hypothetical protein [Nannocystaceae bacterium]